MKRKKKKSSKNTKLAFIFLALVVGIVVFSLIFKIVALISESQFDNAHRFTISLSNNRNLEVVSFSPQTRSISILKLDGNKNLNLYRFLEIPIDADMHSDSIDFKKSPSEILSAVLFNYKNVNSSINVVDIVRLLLFAKIVPSENIYEKHLSAGSDMQTRDKISLSFFSDEKISEENVSVEIVNASDVAGAGGRIARLVSNMGGNVVLVSTATDTTKKSEILYSGGQTYTLLKLENLLGFPAIKNNASSIGNVIIQIGENGTGIKY